MPKRTAVRTTRRQSTPRRFSSTKQTNAHPVQRRIATFLLMLVALIGIGIAGANKTAMNASFTTKTLTTGDNLNTIVTQVQKNVGSELTNIPGTSTLVSRAVSQSTAKALVTTAVQDVYTNTTNSIDFTAMDAAVKSALSSSSTGLSSTISSAIATAILPTLHTYFNNELASVTSNARVQYQKAASIIKQFTVPLVVIAAILAIWLLLAGGFGRLLHDLGWASLLAGLLGLATLQLGQKLPQIDKLTAKAGDFQLVAADYLAQVVNHMSGYYIIAAAVGLVVTLISIPLIRRK